MTKNTFIAMISAGILSLSGAAIAGQDGKDKEKDRDRTDRSIETLILADRDDTREKDKDKDWERGGQGNEMLILAGSEKDKDRDSGGDRHEGLATDLILAEQDPQPGDRNADERSDG